MIFLRRGAARLTHWSALRGTGVLCVLLAACLAWSAFAQFHNAPNTALDFSSRVLSILSVGRLTPETDRVLFAAWDGALALLLLFPRAARLALWLAWPRLVLGVLPMLMLRGDLQTANQQTVLAYALLLVTAIFLSSSRRWLVLESDPRTEQFVATRSLSPQQQARRRKGVLWSLAVVLVLAGVGRGLWPRYLQWFHARQEAAVLDEKLSGKLLKKSMPQSPLLHRKITTWVYLPPGYDRVNVRYPVIYVMHGMPGGVRDCFVKGQIHNAAEQLILQRKIKPVILVGWDGAGPGGATDITNYLDRADGTWPMETFMVRELVPYIDKTYRTIARPQARALCGVSAGGYASVNLLFKHPDVWKTGASHTGFFDPADDTDNMTDILGAKNPLWNVNDPMKTVRRVTPTENLHVYADIGKGDELSAEFSQFCRLLQAQKIDHECHVFPGRHTWDYWSRHFYDSLAFINTRFETMGVFKER